MNRICFKCQASLWLHFSLYLRREGEIVCVYFCVYVYLYVCMSMCTFHCHAKDKRARPVPSCAKPAGCRSCFCFVLCSVFSPRDTLLWRAFRSPSVVPFCMCVCLCVCVCVCVCLSWQWPWCGEKTRNKSGPIESNRELELKCCDM